MSRRGVDRPGVWSLTSVLEREGFKHPGQDPKALDALARSLEGAAVRARDYAVSVEARAAGVANEAHRIRREIERAESFAAKAERMEVCAPVWKIQPSDSSRASVTMIADGYVKIAGIGCREALYSTRSGVPPFGSVLHDGRLDVPATILNWRAFCAARKANAVEPAP